MNWDDLRIFNAVARAKSFSAAARALGINQSTVSRRMTHLEALLGTLLVERSSEGHVLTAAGEELSVFADNMENDIHELGRKIIGRDTRLSGRLRVTCIDMMVDRYLAPHLARFCDAHPDIELSVVAGFQPLDLMRGEADVAIRVSHDPPGPLVGRRLFDFGLAVYGREDVVSRLPANPTPEELPWIGWEREEEHARMIANHFPDAEIRHRVDKMLVANALVQEGLGVTTLPCYWADQNKALRRVFRKPVSGSALGLWILAHPDARRAARLRAFTAFITEIFLADRDRFTGLAPAD